MLPKYINNHKSLCVLLLRKGSTIRFEDEELNPSKDRLRKRTSRSKVKRNTNTSNKKEKTATAKKTSKAKIS